ncbi:MAG: FAD-binding oxidoreductase [Steroidobacteraceae bacterium]|nr:FAD-binding oxidoreductase [Steroidobacteraceae bacterium]
MSQIDPRHTDPPEAGVTAPAADGVLCPSSIASALAARLPPSWLPELCAVVGEANVLQQPADLWAYCRDRSPYAMFNVRNARVPATLPAAVAHPGSVAEVSAILRLSRRRGIAVIPFGAGSGVMGGALPIAHELVVDLKRLNGLLAIDEVDGTATVQAGMNGGQFEAALNARGFTSGHYPQSLHMSTVGGWAACRSAGQSSTRYGKFEDMVLGFEVVLPDGELLRIRPAPGRAVGPGLQDLFLGSEGALGIITEVTLRLWRLPEARHGVVLAFPTLESGLDTLRRAMQSELRPSVARLYDQEESAQRTSGTPPFDSHRLLAILEFSGSSRLAALERDLTLEIARSAGAVEADNRLYLEWLKHRYVSYSTPWYARGYFNDTIEVTGRWSVLPLMYAAMRESIAAIAPDAHFGVHWSHFYPEGACQYMTLRLPPMPDERALAQMRRAWDAIVQECHRQGGSMSHHHGVGLFRAQWMRAEHGSGLDIIAALKRHLDPDQLLLPGKLGLDDPL